MNPLKGLRVVVAGAGAVGSVTAVALARQGAQVLLADPAGAGGNASGVAAGMLAPLLEALLDPACAGQYSMLRQARDAWPALATSLPDSPGLDRSGALLQTADPEPLIAAAKALGADLGPALPPILPDAPGPWLFTSEDWRLDPLPMLAALHRALREADGSILPAALTGFQDGQARFQGAVPWAADAVVLATGPTGADWPDAQVSLQPIKGQILRFPGYGPASGPVVRYRGAYLVPSAQGLVVGATMEEGVDDLAIDAVATERLRATAVAFMPSLAVAPFTASAGVRAATADGLPVVGPSAAGGVVLARGARRNGWLLAPLIAEVIVDHLSGRAPGAAAAAFDPARPGVNVR
jgi:glycine oxidase